MQKRGNMEDTDRGSKLWEEKPIVMPATFSGLMITAAVLMLLASLGLGLWTLNDLGTYQHNWYFDVLFGFFSVSGLAASLVVFRFTKK
jgi:hypothetical protein